MRSDYRKSGFVIAVAIIIVACNSVLYIPSEENTYNKADVARLKQGRTLYINNCASCHTLYAPERYDKTAWTKWVNNMGTRTRLTDDEKAQIISYLTRNK